MPYTVNDCFEKFRKDVVDLEPGQTKTARGSRDFVYKNIGALFQKGLLPRMYPAMNLNFGSFARNTKIRPLDDIDIMICYDGLDGVYDTIQKDKLYHIRFADGHPYFNDLKNDDGTTLNSRKVINQLIDALSGVESYSKAEMHRRGEAATLQLSSYPWNFDIVPCFYTRQGFYLIPDGQGHWKNTDPRIDRVRVAEINQFYDGKALPLIRLMKYWKQQAWGEAISSYMFEQMVLNCISEGKAQGDSWQIRVKSVLSYLRGAIRQPVADPKEIQGDLNTLDTATRIDLSNTAQRSSSMAVLAIASETVGKTEAAIEKWKSVFGNEFPDYRA